MLVAVGDFNHGVDQISFTDQTKRRLEELPLKSRFDVRNDDYEAGVQRCPTIKRQKSRPVVRNECESRSTLNFTSSRSLELPRPRYVT